MRRIKRINKIIPAHRSRVFMPWFEEQFGKRPVPYGKEEIVRKALEGGLQIVNESESLLAACKEYDAHKRAALYAWTVRGSFSK